MSTLSRKTANRKSLLRNLATSLVLFEKIKTTTPKSKETKAVLEHLISIAKQNTLASRRRLLAYFFDENAVKKTIDELVPRYKDLNSGFIRSYKVGPRLGDGAEMTILELINDKKVDDKVEVKVKEATPKKAADKAGSDTKNDK